MKRQMVSLALFGGCVGLTATALYRAWRDPPTLQTVCNRQLAYVLRPSESLLFSVGAASERVLLASAVALPAEVGHQQSFAYALEIEWLDLDGKVVDRQRLWQRSWSPPPPTLLALEQTSGASGSTLLTSPAVEILSIQGRLPQGGALRLTARMAGGELLARLFADHENDGVTSERIQASPTRQERLRLPAKLGLLAWDNLTDTERLQLSRRRWATLVAQGNGGGEVVRRQLHRCAFSVPFEDRPALGITLEPHAATALNFRGSTQVLLSGSDGLQELRFRTVAATAQERLDSAIAAEPLAGFDFTAGILLNVTAREPFSLVVSNNGYRTTSFVASVRHPALQSAFGKPALVPLRTIGGTGRHSHEVLMGPELRQVQAYATSATSSPIHFSVSNLGVTDPIRLTVRAVAAESFTEAGRRLTVRFRDTKGTVINQFETSWHAAGSPFEVVYPLLASPQALSKEERQRLWKQRWSSEPRNFYVVLTAQTAELEVRSDGAALVSAAAQTFLSPKPSTQIETPGLRLRYGNSSTWRKLLAVNHGALAATGAYRRIRSVVRLDLREDQNEGTGELPPPTYVALGPESRAVQEAARVYLVAETEVRPRMLTYYCSFAADESRNHVVDVGAIGDNEGLIGAVLWAPPEALGSRYSIEMGAETWQTDVARTRVTALWRWPVEAASTLRFSGDSRLRLWLRTRGASWPCEAPYRPVTAYPLASGAAVTFLLNKVMPEPLLAISGFGERSATLLTSVDGGGGGAGPLPGMYKGFVRAKQVFHLQPTAARAYGLYAPDDQPQVLQTEMVRLRRGLPIARERLTLRNVGSTAVDVRVSQAVEVSVAHEAAARWLREDGLEVWSP